MAAKKEMKYVVLKVADVESLPPRLRRQLVGIMEQVQIIRRRQGRLLDNKYIICNQDEPYAEKVWQAILDGETEKEKAKAAAAAPVQEPATPAPPAPPAHGVAS